MPLGIDLGHIEPAAVLVYSNSLCARLQVTKPLELKLSLDDKKFPVTPGTLYFSSNGELRSYVDVFRFLIPAALWANLVIAGLWAIWFLSEMRTKRRVFFAFTQVILPLMFLGGWYLLACF